MMSINAKPDESEEVLSRELLMSGTLRDRMVRANAPDLLWTSDQIANSLADTIDGVSREDIWIFGYGSLIWNPIFPVEQTRTARIHGFHRALCLSSVVGRGSQEQPGVMLALDLGGSCHGVALKMGGNDIETELDLLWRREMMAGSYTPTWVNARTQQGNVRTLAFVANRRRPNYVGRLPDDEIICRLSKARGPLGSNLDYLRRTHAGLEAHGIIDRHVSRLLQICEAALEDRKAATKSCETP
jgi:cation transport protein ChaC